MGIQRCLISRKNSLDTYRGFTPPATILPSLRDCLFYKACPVHFLGLPFRQNVGWDSILIYKKKLLTGFSLIRLTGFRLKAGMTSCI